MRPLPVLAVLSGSVVAAVSAWAQEPAVEESARVLEEVIVTAQKREQGLREVPISIAVVDGETLRAWDLLELEDLSAGVPGFTVTEAAIATLAYMRGLGSGINQGFEQSVGMYVDGVYAGRGRQFRASFLDIERVEVLRGPQGILFGKNTVAGAVNITTARPTREFEGEFSALGDAEHGEYQFTGMASGPLGETLSGRFAAKAGGFDGWLYNTALGRDEAAVDDIVLRGALRWEPSDRFGFDLKLEHSDYEVDGRTIQITEAGDFGPFFSAFDPAFEDALDTRKSVAGIGVDRSDTESDLAMLTATWDADRFRLTSVTAWSAYEFLDERDIDFGPVPYLFQTEPQEFDQLSQELRLASTGEGGFDWVVGAYLETSELSTLKAVDADLSWLGVPLPPATRQIGFDQDTDSVALFGQATFTFLEDWRLGVGLRYTREEKSAQQFLRFMDFRTNIPNPVLGTFYAQAGFGVPHVYDQSRDEDDWSPQLSLQWDVTEAVTLYGSAARGFKAGGFNEAEESGDPDNFEFGNETSTTFEAGAKMRLADGAARLDLALFHTTFDDLQVSTFEGIAFVVGNAARATSQGLEVEGEWLITDHLGLQLSWTWLDATWDAFPDAACTVEQAAASGLGPACTQDLAGRPTLYAPKNSGRIALAWTDTLSGGHGLDVQVELVHSDGFYLEQDLDRAEYQPAFQKLNLRLGWRSPGAAWEMALLGRNLTDELTRHHGSDVPLLAGAHYSMTDRPRSVALQVRRFF